MRHESEYKKWLNGLKVGDEIVCYTGTISLGREEIFKITKETKASFFYGPNNSSRFKKLDGSIWGSYSDHARAVKDMDRMIKKRRAVKSQIRAILQSGAVNRMLYDDAKSMLQLLQKYKKD